MVELLVGGSESLLWKLGVVEELNQVTFVHIFVGLNAADLVTAFLFYESIQVGYTSELHHFGWSWYSCKWSVEGVNFWGLKFWSVAAK